MKNKSNLNIDNLPKDLNRNLNQEERKEVYKRIKAGEDLNNKQAKTYINLKPFNEYTREEMAELQRKAAEGRKKAAGEKKTAKQCLDVFLSLYTDDKTHDEIPEDIKRILNKNPEVNITQYDLIMLAMITKARQGDTRAAEFIRDTVGDKPVTETHNINEVITQADRDLISKLSSRLGINPDIIEG